MAISCRGRRWGTRQYGELLGAFQANRDVTEFGERLEVASRPAAKSSILKGGSFRMYCNSAAMFWLTS
jgi:hypothetical protein